MYKHIVHHVKSCHECQIRTTQKAHLPITISPPAMVFTKVHIDIMYMPNAKGFRYLVVARDNLSKFVEGRALKTASAQAVAKFVLEDLIYRHGSIGKIVTDNGPEFYEAFSQTLKQHGIPQIYISLTIPKQTEL